MAVSLSDKILFLNNWGDSLLRLGWHDKAKVAYQRAIGIKETWPSHLGLAKVYIKLGDRHRKDKDTLYAEALSCLKRVSELGDISKDDKLRVEYHFLRGYTYAGLGLFEEAKGDFLKCGEDPLAKKNLQILKEPLEGKKMFPRGLRKARWIITGIFGSLLIACLVFYFWRLWHAASGTTISSSTEIDVLKVLVPTFMVATLVGFFLPYISAFKVPGVIELEMDLKIRPELSPERLGLIQPAGLRD